jgi:phosphoribosylamine--glycine ligase
VTSSRSEAEAFIERLMVKKDFGTAGGRILLEHGLPGEELSYIILTDGEKFLPMVPTRDHKRAFDYDQGPNTGGMGAYSTDEMLPSQLEQTILDTIVQPTLKGLREDRLLYSGFLYFGLMLTADGPKVLEYNCRLGDPETEAILLRANFDLAEACLRAASGDLGMFDAKWSPGASICVVIASEGYPENPVTGRRITGLPEAVGGGRQGVVFHAGTRLRDSSYYTTGGRVLVVAAAGDNVSAASQTAYDTLSKIHIDGSFYRKDIGAAAAGKRSIAAEVSNR